MNFYNKFDKLKMKYNGNSKKIIIPLIALMAIVSLGVGSSYAYLTYFSEAENTTAISAGTLALEFSGESGAIVMNKAVPQLDEDALANNPEYKFSLKNTGTLGVSYSLYFNDICSTSSTYVVDGASVTPNKCIPFDYVNVAIKKGSGEYKVYNLKKYASSKTATLDLANLDPYTTSDEYSMKIWLDYNTPNDYSGEDASGNARNVIFAGQVSVYGEQVTNFENYQKESCFTTSGSSITGYDASCGLDVSIPPVIGGTVITTIADNAFLNKNLNSAILPVSLTSIGASAFKGNNLGCVSIPSTVTTIGDNAFLKNTSSNKNLSGIVNNTTKQFYWDRIINGVASSTNYNFINGVVANSISSVIVSPTGSTCKTVPSVDPAFESVTMTSNNANQTHAKTGDVITVDMITNENITTPTVTIAGANATVTKVSDTRYTATLTVADSTTNGSAKLAISGWKYASGTAGATINKVTSGTYTYIDTTKPVCKATGPFISDTNQTSKTKVKAGEDVYYVLSCTDAGGIATIADADTLTLPSGVSSIRLSSIDKITNGYKYAYRVTASSTTGNVAISFPAGWVKDIAGNQTAAITATGFTVTN